MAKETTHTAESVLAETVGQENAARVLEALDRHGYRIIRHRVISDEELRNISRS